MKDFEVNPKSWSYRMNTKMFWEWASIGPYAYMNPLPKDFCTYWRHTLWSALIGLMYSTFIVGVAFLFGGLVYSIFKNPAEAGIGILYIAAISVFVIGMVNIIPWLGKYVFLPILSTLWKYGLGQIMRPIGYILEQFFLLIGDGFIWISKQYRKVFPKKVVKTPSKDETPTPKEPWLITQKYLALKGKICPRVVYTEESEILND